MIGNHLLSSQSPDPIKKASSGPNTPTSNSFSGTSVTVSVPILEWYSTHFVYIILNKATTINTPTGWTIVGQSSFSGGVSSMTLALFYRSYVSPWDAGDVTFTWAVSGTGRAVSIVCPDSYYDESGLVTVSGGNPDYAIARDFTANEAGYQLLFTGRIMISGSSENPDVSSSMTGWTLIHSRLVASGPAYKIYKKISTVGYKAQETIYWDITTDSRTLCGNKLNMY